MTIFGNVNDSGELATGLIYGGLGPSMLTITGGLTNNQDFGLYGSGDQGFTATLVNNGSVYVGPGATLTLTAQPGGITDVVQGSTFDILGTFNAGSNNAFAGLTSVEGNLYLQNGQTTSINPAGGTFTVSNTGYVNTSSGSTLQVNGDVSNSGLLISSNGSTVQVNGNMNNMGSAGTSLSGTGNAQFNVTGTLTNQPGGFFALWNSGDSAMVGNLVNQGTVQISPGATLDPMRVDNFGLINIQAGGGGASGTMIVGTGTPGGPGYYQFANGTLGKHISMSQFGVVTVGANGAVDLNGTLDIQLASGFNPSIGTSYDIITFTSGDLTGTFSSVLNNIFNNGTEKWTVIYSDSGGYVELLAQSNNSTVPEPGTLLLLGSGLLSLGYGVRLRFKK